MSIYSRRGHFRANKNGTVAWVRDHVVTRRSPYATPQSEHSPYLRRPSLFTSDEPARAALSINIWNDRRHNRNAQCPVCGQNIYFYQNENGSAVFFDELGPPWPKHPCTVSNPLPPTVASPFDSPTTSPSWQKNGWIPLRSAKLSQTGDEYELSGYSRGVRVQFSLNAPSLNVITDIKMHKAIWHYRTTHTRQDCTHVAGVYTGSHQFHELAITSLHSTT